MNYLKASILVCVALLNAHVPVPAYCLELDLTPATTSPLSTSEVQMNPFSLTLVFDSSQRALNACLLNISSKPQNIFKHTGYDFIHTRFDDKHHVSLAPSFDSRSVKKIDMAVNQNNFQELLPQNHECVQGIFHQLPEKNLYSLRWGAYEFLFPPGEYSVQVSYDTQHDSLDPLTTINIKDFWKGVVNSPRISLELPAF